MDDIRNLLLNQVRAALGQLEQIGVGHADLEQSDGITYIINGMNYIIKVERAD